MEEVKLDCQGLACPQPVLQCRNTINQKIPYRLVVIVDNEAAKQNVSRFLESQDYKVQNIQKQNGVFELIAEHAQSKITKQEPRTNDSKERAIPQTAETIQEEKQLVFVTSDKLGHGDDELGEKLMHNFLATLPELGDSLWRIILINSGVKLAIQRNAAINHLKELEKSGVSILVCGTCLDHFQLLEQKQVGSTTNMMDVITSLQLASKIIKV